MLRPAYLLPDARLLPRLGLSIPRSGRRNLFRRLGPAIRCFGAYRLGTLTRWRTAASVRELRLLRGILLFRVTTHHAPIIPETAIFRYSPLNPVGALPVGALRNLARGRRLTREEAKDYRVSGS